MGSICCCFGVSEANNHGDSNDTGCLCFKCIMNKFGVLFGGGNRLAIPPSNERAVSSNSVVAHNGSPASNIRYSPVPSEIIVTRQDKGSSHSCVEPEPLRDTGIQANAKMLGVENKSADDCCGRESKEGHSESSMKGLLSRQEIWDDYAHSFSEDDDFCPTCFEEYTSENPKIIAQCSHHYHLSCIYEWQERSEKCPACGMLMIFDETS